MWGWDRHIWNYRETPVWCISDPFGLQTAMPALSVFIHPVEELIDSVENVLDVQTVPLETFVSAIPMVQKGKSQTLLSNKSPQWGRVKIMIELGLFQWNTLISSPLAMLSLKKVLLLIKSNARKMEITARVFLPAIMENRMHCMLTTDCFLDLNSPWSFLLESGMAHLLGL